MYSQILLDQFNQLENSRTPDPGFNVLKASQLLKPQLQLFEDRLRQNNGFLAGSKLTYADLYLSQILDNLVNLKNETLTPYPNVIELDLRIRKLPRIHQWLAKRPQIEF